MYRLFENPQVIKEYIQFRPKYTQQIAKSVMNYYKTQQKTNGFESKPDLMVDVGCGSGQSSNLFQPYFNKILAIDVSKEQLKQAKQQNLYNNIFYESGSAENIPVPDESVDLIVSGTAVHWFDLPKFYEEVQRVLKPSGCLAIFSYYIPRLSLSMNDEESLLEKTSGIFQSVLFEGNENNEALKTMDKHLTNRYVDIYNSLPFSNKQRDDSIHLINQCSINDLCGLITTVDTYRSFMKSKMEKLRQDNVELTNELISSIDPVEKFVKKLEDVLKLKKNEPRNRKFIYTDHHVFLLLAMRKVR